MATRTANAQWNGDLQNGKGRMTFGGGAFDGQYSFSSRFEEGTGTNPEELIAAAHAGCFSMALSNILAEAGYSPESVHTEAQVELEFLAEGPTVTRIRLDTEGTIPGIDPDDFQHHAELAKKGCPISRLLSGTEISVDARLK